MPDRCEPIRERIQAIDAEITALQDQLSDAPPSARASIVAKIRRKETEQLRERQRLTECEAAPPSLDPEPPNPGTQPPAPLDLCAPIREKVQALEGSITALQDELGNAAPPAKPAIAARIRQQEMILSVEKQNLFRCEHPNGELPPGPQPRDTSGCDPIRQKIRALDNAIESLQNEIEDDAPTARAALLAKIRRLEVQRTIQLGKLDECEINPPPPPVEDPGNTIPSVVDRCEPIRVRIRELEGLIDNLQEVLSEASPPEKASIIAKIRPREMELTQKQRQLKRCETPPGPTIPFTPTINFLNNRSDFNATTLIRNSVTFNGFARANATVDTPITISDVLFRSLLPQNDANLIVVSPDGPARVNFAVPLSSNVLSTSGNEEIEIIPSSSPMCVGFEIYTNGSAATVDVFGIDGSGLGSHIVPGDTPTRGFLGIVANVPIARVHWRASNGQFTNTGIGELVFGSNLFPGIVVGDIRIHWEFLGGPEGLLGVPLHGELPTSDGIGRFNRFRNGMIYWTPQTGAFELHGEILDRWSSLGFELSYFGYPISDEKDFSDPNIGNGRISHFQYGRIAWTREDGPIEFPDSASIHVDVSTDAALGGFVDAQIKSNGDFDIFYHMSATGFFSFKVRLVCTMRTATGQAALVSLAHGEAEGDDVLFSPKRNWDFHDQGNSNELRQLWPHFGAGTILHVSPQFSIGGPLEFIGDTIADIAKFVFTRGILNSIPGVGPAAAAIYTGVELGSITGIRFGDPEDSFPGLVMAGTTGLLISPLVGIAIVVALAGANPESRRLRPEEIEFARQVFKDSIPYERVVLTNLSGIGTAEFTIPHIDNTILVNMGVGFTNPLKHINPNIVGHQIAGQVFIHEMTHAWQIAHNPTIKLFQDVIDAKLQGDAAYMYGPPDQGWDQFGLEQQGSIVDDWFAGTCDHMRFKIQRRFCNPTLPDPEPRNPDLSRIVMNPAIPGMDITDVYFKYIQELRSRPF